MPDRPQAPYYQIYHKIIPKINSDDRTQAIDQYARSGKLERSIAPTPVPLSQTPTQKTRQ
ncbi:MAG: hypothetical protein JGK12_12095 [Microcoleus sp. PH2017_01_SCD_O_A]|uniref:hypothetical protein n=1 Tax=unclassified Microcoleus TaxID=2642155 RepID=UPI001D87ACB5|nr:MULTISPECIES: hypothetical protein [unclassified Microcoleus]TAG65458.1 MAG: hypothetical protein EAZ25_15915 [Oscillatoriales cyanobacterium]MCC3424648.1 hypothetical protein [Microcoleus sp. PH2017_01_SCD_O_A]MCC3454675.1 hypothetical protein [Microcoleus sp. PH2017_08_TRC_O_A]MCC3473367.1 hypothetical protein [Microcoleus sp. PH2017_13_LAR_U_A]MCC3485685.1 hypothetical protein [Microcoleus sp. PH2017_14_LAR_D_A]